MNIYWLYNKSDLIVSCKLHGVRKNKRSFNNLNGRHFFSYYFCKKIVPINPKVKILVKIQHELQIEFLVNFQIRIKDVHMGIGLCCLNNTINYCASF